MIEYKAKPGNLMGMAHMVVRKNPYYFCVLNLRELSSTQLDVLSSACEQIETACWRAKEDFSSYFKKNDVLAYVVFQNTIVGFLLASRWLDKDTAVCALEEMMILKEHRGQGFWKPLKGLVNHFVLKNYTENKNVKYACNILNTCNPAIIHLAKRHKYLYKKSNFSPNKQIIDLANKYINDYGCVVLDESNPFFLKATFSGCSKIVFKEDEKEMKSILPSNFKFSRGDSMLAIGLRRIKTELLMTKWALLPYFKIKASVKVCPNLKAKHAEVVER